MSTVATDVSFREVQRFRQPWLWALLAVVSLSAIVSGGPIGLLVAGAIVVFMWSLRLETEVRADGLYLKFTPFHQSFRHVPWSEMDSVEAVTYRPIREYGGWGIRWGSGKLAYNVSGSQGVRIERTADKELLVGSQQPYDLARMMRNAMQNAKD